MKRRELKASHRRVSALLVCALAAGCAQHTAPGTQPEPEPTAGNGDGRLDEITVTATRAENPRSRAQSRRQSMGLRESRRFDDAALPPLSSDEELWVVAMPAGDTGQTHLDDSPGSGAMIAHFPDDADAHTKAAREIPLPLQHTAVKARLDGYISTVDVQQQFSNPFDRKIEAVYMFPLPEKAAVSEFVMTVGERKIRGILREKEEAEAIYREARSQGYRASLLVQHRPNVFEQKVANIEPGHSIDVSIQYFHTLAYNDGWYSFVFPTVVGPRYNPPGHGRPLLPVARGSVPDDEGQTTVAYLRPGERSGHDVSIEVEIDAGVAIEELRSTHEIDASRTTPDTATVALVNRSTIPNRDFVLDFRVAGEAVKSSLMTYVDPASQEGYFTLMLFPPSGTASLNRQPMEMVFVLDCSGSMSGRPLNRAKNAVSVALDRLNENDTFQIIRFSENSTQLGPAPLPATRDNIRLARQYLRSLSGTGGTEMIEGIKAALDFPHDPSRLRFVSFMTDGYIGNETDILAALHERIGESRVFSFGLGSSVNRYLLERMARVGRGAVAYLGPQDSAKRIMDDFFTRISHPALTDISIDWGSMSVSDVYPAKLPDMFIGRAVVVTGKFIGAPTEVHVLGMTGTTRQRYVVDAAAADEPKSGIPKIWARLRIADLVDRQAWEDSRRNELAVEIKDTALEYELVSDYTSFVAVDASRRTEGDFGVTVPQAVPVPDGVRYDTTVEER